MATQSFYEDLVLRTPDTVRNIGRAIELADKRESLTLDGTRGISNNPLCARRFVEKVDCGDAIGRMARTSGYGFISLAYLLDAYGEDTIRKCLSSFTCERGHGNETYLRNQAIDMEKKSMSRTYLAVTDEGIMLGYFSIGMSCVVVPDNIPISRTINMALNIDGETGVAQSFLIGQLGCGNHSPEGFGKELLFEALCRIAYVSRIVGGRIVRLDCIDELIRFYEDNGFVKVSRNESGSLNQMVILI